jgi:threonine dehydratase
MTMATIPLRDLLAARRRIRPFLRPTPLLHSPWLSEQSGGDVWLKPECEQATRSFKIRGALHKIGGLSPAEKQRGVVTASAGNHGLGVAYAAGVWDSAETPMQTDIFVPENAPAAKVDKLRRYPITLHRSGETYDAAHRAADAFAAEKGAVSISAYDDPVVIAGQGTLGLEIVEEAPDVDAILVPVGGGGMIAGVAAVAQSIALACRVIGVQPKASPAALLSLRDGVAYDPYDHEPTLADGLAGGFGATPLAVAGDLIHSIELSDEATLRRAVHALMVHHQLMVEPSGAIAIAPLLSGQLDLSGQTVVCILSGGNLDIGIVERVVEEFGS